MTALRGRVSTSKSAKRKSSRKVATTKVGKAKGLGKKSTSKATGKGPLREPLKAAQAEDGRRARSTSFAGVQRTPLSKPLKHAPRKAVKPGAVGLERLTRLFAHASRALGTKAEAGEFMKKPHPELGGLRPLEVATTDLGVRRVEEILHALEYGLAL